MNCIARLQSGLYIRSDNAICQTRVEKGYISSAYFTGIRGITNKGRGSSKVLTLND